MKRLRFQFALLAGSMMMFFPTQDTQAGDTGGYLRLDGGVNLAENPSIEMQGFNGKLQLDTGFRADAAIGYDLCRWAAVEVEAGYFYNSVESLTLMGQTADLKNSDVQGIPILANFIVSYRNHTDFVPYIGVGAGGVVSMLSIDNETDNAMVFAYQLRAGVIYKLDDRAWVDLSYKFLATDDPEYDVGNQKIKASDVRNHFIGVSVVWRF